MAEDSLGGPLMEQVDRVLSVVSSPVTRRSLASPDVTKWVDPYLDHRPFPYLGFQHR